MSEISERVAGWKRFRDQGQASLEEARSLEAGLRREILAGATTGDWLTDLALRESLSPASEAALRDLGGDMRAHPGQLVLQVFKRRIPGEVTGDLVGPIDDVRIQLALSRLDGELSVCVMPERPRQMVAWGFHVTSGPVAETPLSKVCLVAAVRLRPEPGLIVPGAESCTRDQIALPGSDGRLPRTAIRHSATGTSDLYVGDDAVARYFLLRGLRSALAGGRPDATYVRRFARLAALIGETYERSPALALCQGIAFEAERQALRALIERFGRGRAGEYDRRELQGTIEAVERGTRQIGLLPDPCVLAARELLPKEGR